MLLELQVPVSVGVGGTSISLVHVPLHLGQVELNEQGIQIDIVLDTVGGGATCHITEKIQRLAVDSCLFEIEIQKAAAASSTCAAVVVVMMATEADRANIADRTPEKDDERATSIFWQQKERKGCCLVGCFGACDVALATKKDCEQKKEGFVSKKK